MTLALREEAARCSKMAVLWCGIGDDFVFVLWIR